MEDETRRIAHVSFTVVIVWAFAFSYILTSFQGLLLRPFPCNLEESPLLDLVGRLVVDRCRAIRMCQHAQNDLYNLLNFLIRQPLLFSQHFLADLSILDIGVIDRCSEPELREFEGKLLRKVDIYDKFVALIGTVDGSTHQQLPMIKILLYRRHYSSK